MAIRTFSAQERYKEGGPEPRKKLKKVRSVKVANLDRLRMSMRREKTRLYRGIVASSDDATDISGPSSAAISGTSSPNYMKATTSSSARKGSLQVSSGSTAASAKSTSKFSKGLVQETSDPASVNIPVKVKTEKIIRRMPSLRHSKKLSSKKSKKIRERYSQFSEVGINQGEMLEFDRFMGIQDNAGIIEEGMEFESESSDISAFHGQDSMVMAGGKQKGILQRSRSRKLARMRSARSLRTRQRQQSRLSGGATELMSHEAEPHYMKATSSQQARKNSDKGLTRTSSLRPLRILAKIPSIRPKRSRSRKRPQATPVSVAGVDRATCSSILKRTEIPEDIESHSRVRELEGTSNAFVCPYSYCSIHGHRHQRPSQPVIEFISVKRKNFSNQKGEQRGAQSSGDTEYYMTDNKTDQSRKIVSAESNAAQEMMNVATENVLEADDDGMDYLIKIYAKSRKKWVTEGALSKDAEALNASDYDQISVGDYEGKLVDILSETSGLEANQEALNDDQQDIYEISSECNTEPSNKTQQQNSNFAALSFPLELHDVGLKLVSIDKALDSSIAGEYLKRSSKNPLLVASSDSEVSSGGYLTNMLSDKQKYTSMWQLIHQQLISSEASMNEAQGLLQADEKEGGDGNNCRELSNLDVKQSKCNNNLNEDGDDQVAATKKLELDQTAAIKLVQGALDGILQQDMESYHQWSNAVQDMATSFAPLHKLTPKASTEESFKKDSEIDGKEMSLESAEEQNKMKQIGNTSLRKEPYEQEKSGRQMSKSLSRLKKVFVTAKFMKAMERMKRMNPRKTHFLSAEFGSENERVYLTHLSMNQKKNTEEWMLDFALRQVISRLDPDQQRRVAHFVEAFETVNPEQEEKRNRKYPVTNVPAPGNLVIPMNGEKKQFVEPKQDIPFIHEQVEKDDEVLVSHKDFLENTCLKDEHGDQVNETGDNTLESDEAKTSDSTLVLSEKTSESVCVNTTDDGGIGNEEPIYTFKVPSQFSARDSVVSLANDTSNIFSNKQKYTTMWNLIYQHVASKEASIDEKQVHLYDEEQDGDTKNFQEMNDRDSSPSVYCMVQKEGDGNQTAACEKPDLDQSAAVNIVKEALSAILKRYEQSTQLQSFQDHHSPAEDVRDLYISTPTSYTEENTKIGAKSAEKDTYSVLEDELHHVENTSLQLQQQVECDESKAPQRKMSKGLSKLKKAIATARFIKAMQRLTKSSPRKSQNMCSDKTSEEERVYLRHRSVHGRKKDEEWMLDYALRQVVSKLDPDQQRKVALLVQAFETMDPEQKGKSSVCHPFKGDAADRIGLATSTNVSEKVYVGSQQQRSTFVEQVPQNQDGGILAPTRDTSLERRPYEYHNQPASSTDDINLHDTDVTAISDSNRELSENDSRLPSVVVTHEAPNIGDKETRRAIELPSPFSIGNPEVRPDSDVATILFDKQKYTSMWHLIYQHVLSNEASTDGKTEVNEVSDEKQGDEACTGQAINDPDSTQSTQMKTNEVDEDSQSAVFDQSAAINMVKEAINAILQSHEQRSDKQPLEGHGIAADNARELCDTTVPASTKENSGEKRVEKKKNSEPEEKQHKVEGSFQQQAEPNEAKKTERKMSKSLSKLKKAIVTAKFIKAMERLRKINPCKPRYLSLEMASEEERINLRHLSINGRKNDEEWMLDYALRKVISSLAPDQQRKVALLVEAFETMHPEQKGIRYPMKSECDPAIDSEGTTNKKQILDSKQESSMSYDDDSPRMHNDTSNILGKGDTMETSAQEDNSIKFSNLRTESSCEILDPDDSNLLIHHHTSSRGSLVSDSLNIITERKEESDANGVHEKFQGAKNPELDSEANIAKGIFGDKSKNVSMWHLIYQHAKSVSAAEIESRLSERLTSEDQMNSGGGSSEMIADADADADANDRDASSVASELTESEAIKLVREAISDILDAPEDHENESFSSDRTAVTEEAQSAAVEEKPKILSRGYSKLRKLIICNKFIKAMEKTRKLRPQKLSGLALSSDSDAGKARRKTYAVGEKKGMDEWMLDDVLQKVIAGLAPVQQRRVSLLVEAFEKVNPDSEGREKGLSFTKIEFPVANFSEAYTKEKKDTLSSQSSVVPGAFDLKLDKATTSSRDDDTKRIPEEIHKDKNPGLIKEYVSNEGSSRSGGPCSVTAATSDVIKTLAVADTCRDPTEIDGAEAQRLSLEEKTNVSHQAHAQLEERPSIGKQFGNNELAPKFAKPSQPVDLEDERNSRAQKSRSLEKTTSLWGLILQHATTDMLEKNETPKTSDVDADVEEDSTKTLERRSDDSSQVSSKVKSCRDMGVQTPTDFEFQEDEAVKLVEEAVEEMLLLQDQICDTESMTSSTTSEQEFGSLNVGDVREPSPAATEIVEVAKLNSVATPDEEKTSSKEDLSRTYSTLSKVILCKRFVKAMDKMRKLKALRKQDLSQPHPSEEGTPSLRQILTNDNKSWEEVMLDFALQKVIVNLAPAKKQRVAMLVKAFETVGSQSEPTNSLRAKASVS